MCLTTEGFIRDCGFCIEDRWKSSKANGAVGERVLAAWRGAGTRSRIAVRGVPPTASAHLTHHLSQHRRYSGTVLPGRGGGPGSLLKLTPATDAACVRVSRDAHKSSHESVGIPA